jgi:putative ABC transport system substrate-binding protein
MRRRDFINLISGTVAAWPLAARGQQGERVRRIGVLMPLPPDDPVAQARFAVFQQRLDELGWKAGQNVQIDIRWAASGATDFRKYSTELLALAPDVVLATGSATVGPLLQATRSVPVVFAVVPDPVGAGYVDNLARPGGNATGFTTFECGIGAKWLELLKEITPGVTRAGVLRDPAISAGLGQFGAIQSVAPSVGLEVSPINVRDTDEIQRGITAFTRSGNGGLIVTGSAQAVMHRDLIVSLAASYKLPAVYWDRTAVAGGGLISFGPKLIDQYRQAAVYVDRILKGERPGDLPVQAPSKYELVINLKTAKVLGVTVPPSLLARADEVIE